MGLIEQGKVIIEVGLNEWVSKEQNPNVPYGVDEVIEAGVACAEAGAAVLHFHARGDDGTQRWTDAAIYRAEMEGIARHADVIMYPSYNADFSAIWDLLDAPPDGAPMVIAPFDVFQDVGIVKWDKQAKEFASFANDTLSAKSDPRPEALLEIVRRGQVPTVCTQDLGDIRWTRHALESGLISAPVALKLFIIDNLLKGAEPTPIGLDALLSHVTDDMEPTVVPSLMSSAEETEALLRHAMRNGAHVRVGVGDNPAAYPRETNAELVSRCVEIAAEEGLEPATAADVRAFFAVTS